jgi:hypothetical protein
LARLLQSIKLNHTPQTLEYPWTLFPVHGAALVAVAEFWSSYIPVNHRIDHPGPPANLREVVETFDFNPNGWHNSVWPKQK